MKRIPHGANAYGWLRFALLAAVIILAAWLLWKAWGGLTSLPKAIADFFRALWDGIKNVFTLRDGPILGMGKTAPGGGAYGSANSIDAELTGFSMPSGIETSAIKDTSPAVIAAQFTAPDVNEFGYTDTMLPQEIAYYNEHPEEWAAYLKNMRENGTPGNAPLSILITGSGV